MNTLTPRSVVKLSDKVKVNEDLGKGDFTLETLDTNGGERVFVFSDVAKDIISKIDGKNSIIDIARDLEFDYDVSFRVILKDVVKFLNKLKNQRFII